MRLPCPHRRPSQESCASFGVPTLFIGIVKYDRAIHDSVSRTKNLLHRIATPEVHHNPSLLEAYPGFVMGQCYGDSQRVSSNCNGLEPEIGAVFFCILGTLAVVCASKRTMAGTFVAVKRCETIHCANSFCPIG